MNFGIEKRLQKALEAFSNRDLEEALFQVASAIDATAKKRYPKQKPSRRVQNFLRDEQDLIYGFSTQNKFVVGENGAIWYGDDGEIQQIIYKYIRCSQTHEAIPDFGKIQLGGEFGIGRVVLNQNTADMLEPGKYLISAATVLALIFSVICSSESSNLDIDDWSVSLLGDSQVPISQFKGSKECFKDYYCNKFGN